MSLVGGSLGDDETSDGELHVDLDPWSYEAFSKPTIKSFCRGHSRAQEKKAFQGIKKVFSI